ncbi:MAG: 30S ribosomal protein S11 [Candidatus Nealsonbacteria bacterium]|nr:MAG: 30S ribosomal protein S11 [Candidatus Nealsonbacteria bacterium]
MGKKRIIQQTEEELIKEREGIEKAVQKDVKVALSEKIREGRVYISSTYNNTIITLTDPEGKTIYWASAGSIGFKGTKKATPFAASKVADAVSQIIKKLGIQKIAVFVKGVGGGRDSAIRSLAAKNFDIISITDLTPVPHDGPRPPKARRV